MSTSLTEALRWCSTSLHATALELESLYLPRTMPKTQYIGKRRAELRESVCAWSSEVKRLADALRPLSRGNAASVFLDALPLLQSSPRTNLFRHNAEVAIEKLRKRGWDRGFMSTHEELAQVADRAFRSAFLPSPPKAQSVCGERNNKRVSSGTLASLPAPPTQTTTSCDGEPQTLQQPSTIVSDSEDAMAAEVSPPRTTEHDDELERLAFWCQLLEAVQLHATLLGQGPTRRYSVYQLAGPVMSTISFDKIRHRLARSFLSLCSGSSSGKRHHGECRVYHGEREGKVWVQMNLGQPGESTADYDIKGSSSDLTEMLIVMVPDSALVAVATSRSANRFVRILLSSLEHTLTCSVLSNGK